MYTQSCIQNMKFKLTSNAIHIATTSTRVIAATVDGRHRSDAISIRLMIVKFYVKYRSLNVDS